jgi:LPS sulfotransferase NodH
MNAQKIIWLFREPRSGSTWLTRKLSELTNREHVFIEKSMLHMTLDKRLSEFAQRKQQDQDFNSVLSTHHFTFLEHIGHYTNPLLIRTVRKNTTEQFISHCLAKMTQWRHPNLHPESNLAVINDSLKQLGTGHIIPRRQVENYVQQKKTWDQQWNEYASMYENCTISYEDMIAGFDLPQLALYDLQMKEVDSTMPMPYNKQEIILNYDQIDRWIKELL